MTYLTASIYSDFTRSYSEVTVIGKLALELIWQMPVQHTGLDTFCGSTQEKSDTTATLGQRTEVDGHPADHNDFHGHHTYIMLCRTQIWSVNYTNRLKL
jgi:hypothetical protein